MPYFLEQLNHFTWFPVHPPTIKEFNARTTRGTKWTRTGNYVGNGPFILTEHHVNSVIMVERNPEYWDAAQVRLNGIRFYPIESVDTEERAFHSGFLHLTQTVSADRIDSLKKEKPDLIHFEPYLGTYFYRFNVDEPPFDDVRVRKAMNLAIDRESLVKNVTKGGQQPAVSFTPTDTGGFIAKPSFRYDVEEAKKLIKEYLQTQKVINDEKIDIIISDSRYGVYSKGAPAYFIIHQLRFQLSGIFKFIEFLGEWFNIFMFRHYNAIIIPDVKISPNLTGDLTHAGKIAHHPKLQYLGVFCSVTKLDIEEDIDYFFSVSGPEIQRTLFEEIILGQIDNIPGKKVVVLGKPEDEQSYDYIEYTEIYSHVNREKQNELLNRAKFVVCRSGYTTVMELVALKKPALMIPTPGQTEQEYLAHHYQGTGIFHIAKQDGLSLSAELNKIQNFSQPSMDHIPVNDTKAFGHLLNS